MVFDFFFRSTKTVDVQNSPSHDILFIQPLDAQKHLRSCSRSATMLVIALVVLISVSVAVPLMKLGTGSAEELCGATDLGCHTCPPFIAGPYSSIVSGCGVGDLKCSISCDFANTSLSAECNGTEWFPSLKCPASSARLVSFYKFSEFKMNFAAIGDWGTSPSHYSTTMGKTKENDDDYYYHYNAQKWVGYLLGIWAEENNPRFVLGHGDSFYWNGVWSKDDWRWYHTFERLYPNRALYIPWYNVMGNHDFGGGGNLDGGQEKMVQLLNAQRKYKSPKNDRWVMEDFYYTKIQTFESGNDSFSIEIFNIDTNVASNHGFDWICCQNYGYFNMDCDDSRCAVYEGGGCAPVEHINSCRDYLRYLYATSLIELEKDLIASTATWKVINTHYSPEMHMNSAKAKKLYNIVDKYGVQVYFFGHTHAEGHDYRVKTHYLMNGAGGGRKRSSGHGDLFSSGQYAFMGCRLSKEVMQVEFYTLDDNWGDFSGKRIENGTVFPVIGGMKMKHCWRIPVDGSLGERCREEDSSHI